MARGYTVATLALALDTTPKWVDNVLSHYVIPGVTQSRQGVPRRISFDAALILSVLNALSGSLRIPVEVAILGAEELARAGVWEASGGIRVSLERASAVDHLQSRLAYAVEAAPLPRRGRPSTTAKRGA